MTPHGVKPFQSDFGWQSWQSPTLGWLCWFPFFSQYRIAGMTFLPTSRSVQLQFPMGAERCWLDRMMPWCHRGSARGIVWEDRLSRISRHYLPLGCWLGWEMVAVHGFQPDQLWVGNVAMKSMNKNGNDELGNPSNQKYWLVTEWLFVFCYSAWHCSAVRFFPPGDLSRLFLLGAGLKQISGKSESI